MRHRLIGRQLSRNAPHRRALLRNLSVALLRHETIRTTLAKAKELRRVVEPLITLGKTDTESRRRLAFARLRDMPVVEKLFDDLGPRFQARAGGYTRILHMMPRPGDSAEMALMQLVDRAAPATEDTLSEAGATEGKGKAKAKAKGKKAKTAKPASGGNTPKGVKPRVRKAAAAIG